MSSLCRPNSLTSSMFEHLVFLVPMETEVLPNSCTEKLSKISPSKVFPKYLLKAVQNDPKLPLKPLKLKIFLWGAPKPPAANASLIKTVREKKFLAFHFPLTLIPEIGQSLFSPISFKRYWGKKRHMIL